MGGWVGRERLRWLRAGAQRTSRTPHAHPPADSLPTAVSGPSLPPPPPPHAKQTTKKHPTQPHLTAGSLAFFIFRSRTTAYFFSRVVRFGGAKYIKTGRGYAIDHLPFVKVCPRGLVGWLGGGCVGGLAPGSLPPLSSCTPAHTAFFPPALSDLRPVCPLPPLLRL